MTLILKSNVSAANSIGSIHGNDGPSDFVAMLDFARDEYYTLLNGTRTDYRLADAVAVSRTSVAPYALRDGVMRSAPAATPRRHYLSSYDAEGVMVLQGRANIAASAAGGSIAIPPALEGVILSYKGGSAELSHANLTLAFTGSIDGRTVKRYTRSTTAAFTATLSVSDSPVDVQIELAIGGNFASPFMGYTATVATETLTLKSPFKGLLAGGAGTVVTRNIALRNGDLESRSFVPVAVQTASPLGGLVLRSSRGTLAAGTDGMTTIPDGGAWNAGTSRGSVVGNWRDSFVTGIGFSGNGDAVKIASYGQINKASGLGALFGVPTGIYLGGFPPMANAPGRLGGIITHCIIYDRLLSDDELLTMANQWL